MARKFSRIENLWPRDGSCPLPLRSKRIFNKCFQIVKTQKISSGALLVYVDHRLLRTKFLPLFVQRRWRKSRYHVRTAHAVVKVQLSRKEKYRPRSTGEGFCRVKRRQNESGVLRGGSFFRGFFLTEVVGLTVITNHFCRRFAINLQVQWDL